MAKLGTTHNRESVGPFRVELGQACRAHPVAWRGQEGAEDVRACPNVTRCPGDARESALPPTAGPPARALSCVGAAGSGAARAGCRW